MKTPRTRQINIRASEEEWAFWQALSEESGTKISSLVRAAAQIGLGVPSAEEANIRSFPEAISQLSRAGNNLNQLTRRANQGHLVLSDAQAEAVEATHLAVKSLIKIFAEYQSLAQRRDLNARIQDLKR